MDCACGTNHLDKPFEPWELVERIGKILEKDSPMRRRTDSAPGILDLVLREK
jgi:hypothetical protein